MQELIPIVTDLLAKHTCVIIPDFGGFIVNEKNAVVNAAGDYFFPPHKELIFNSHLSHNDGLLAHAFMQYKNISFDEADRIIAERVNAAKKELETDKKYSLGDFGFFSLETTGIIFHAKEIEIENVDAFGLKEFYFPTLQVAESANIRKRSVSSKVIMGGIAATIALFLFCQPLKNDGETNRASLFPTASFSETAIRNIELIAKEKAFRESSKAKELNYYLVIEELESEEEAVAFIHSIELEKDDFLSILPVGEKFLITFASSLETEKMNDRMKDFRSRYTAFPDAFILGLE